MGRRWAKPMAASVGARSLGRGVFRMRCVSDRPSSVKQFFFHRIGPSALRFFIVPVILNDSAYEKSAILEPTGMFKVATQEPHNQCSSPIFYFSREGNFSGASTLLGGTEPICSHRICSVEHGTRDEAPGMAGMRSLV